MDHGTPTPPDPESLSHGHEMTDVALKPIIIFLIVLILFGGVIQTAMSFVMRGLARESTKIAEPPKLSDLQDHNVPGGPAALQKDTTRDMLMMYAEEDQILDTYHTDSRTKAIRVPLDRAMQIVAKKGLPTRPNPPKMDTSKDLPYPAKSQPYKAAP